MRVVIVDDCEADRSLYRSMLHGEVAHPRSLEFLEAPTAAEGLQLCRAASPDCVLLDYHLPEMTGVEFLSRLRAEFSRSEGAGLRRGHGEWPPRKAIESRWKCTEGRRGRIISLNIASPRNA